MERCVQFKAEAHDLFLLEVDERSDNFDVSLTRTCLNQTLKSLVILWATVGVAGAILLHRAYKDLFRADYFRPAHRRGEKMRAAKGHVSHWYGTTYRLPVRCIRHCDGRVREGRTTYFPE